jgi:hypothetical protein
MEIPGQSFMPYAASGVPIPVNRVEWRKFEPIGLWIEGW